MNMSEEEDCDDLPSIAVNTSVNNSNMFAMPSAEQLAEQRARERECERRLELLRQRARDDELAPRHSDSSGSDGEQALAAAVTALSVRAPPARAPPPRAAALWAALLPRLPPHAAALAAPAPARAVLALAAALAAARAPWPDDELLCAAALLSVAVLAPHTRSRAAARTLHALLDDRATDAQVSAVTRMLLASFPAAHIRLQLSDALRSGGDAGADRAAFQLTYATMLDLLRSPDEKGEAWEAREGAEAGPAASLERVARAAAAWRACGADARYVCVQLAGRLLAATSATGATGATGATDATQTERARLLAQLAPPPACAGDAQRPARLKALVGASKLKLLFCAKNVASRQTRAQRDTST